MGVSPILGCFTQRLVRNWARVIDSSLGRFLSPDSIVPSVSNPQTFNRYSYVYNNPVNFVDSNGQFGWFVPFVVAAFKGAAIGAAVGAATAAITGGDIGKGALFGAIGGAAFAGTFSAFSSLSKFAMLGTTNVSLVGSVGNTVSTIGNILGGAAGGAAGSAFLGTDVGRGAGIGALSGGVFGRIGAMKATGWAGVGRIGLAGVAGGGISELAGGSFTDGFIFASSVASADFIYRAILASAGERTGASMKTATKNGQPKQDVNGNPIGGGQEIVLHEDLQINHVGKPSMQSYVANSKDYWMNFIAGETGPVMGGLGKYGAGFQGLSLAHDRTGFLIRNIFGESAWEYFGNFQTMPPIYGLNLVGSSINDNPSSIGLFIANRRDL